MPSFPKWWFSNSVIPSTIAGILLWRKALPHWLGLFGYPEIPKRQNTFWHSSLLWSVSRLRIWCSNIQWWQIMTELRTGSGGETLSFVGSGIFSHSGSLNLLQSLSFPHLLKEHFLSHWGSTNMETQFPSLQKAGRRQVSKYKITMQGYNSNERVSVGFCDNTDKRMLCGKASLYYTFDET